MNFVPVITHALAILVGWLLVSFASIPETGGRQTGDMRANRPFRTTPPHQRPSPPALLAALAETAMDPGLRATLKRRILADWAAADPDGLLRHLGQRPWPSGAESAANMALHTIARTRPADLLAYAKREGCTAAINSLVTHGDPRLVLDLLLAQPPGVINDLQLAALFSRGCELDPDFHAQFDRIEDPETRIVVFRAVAGTLLEQKRDETFFPWLAEHVDTLPSGPVVRLFTSHLVQTRSDVDRLSRLPDSIRPAALQETLRELAGTDPLDSEGYQRTSLTTCLENGWLDKQLDLASAVVSGPRDFPPADASHRSMSAAAWKDWGLALPEDPKWDSLRRTAIRRWALTDPGQWKTIAKLPSGDLRDAAYATALHTIDLSQEANSIPWIFDQITDPALRNVSAQVISARLKDDQNDPSASAGIDPFKPLGHP